jgi:uncharacterized membrane protein YeaQ/YmgE (transglycosylase-associated protein family)
MPHRGADGVPEAHVRARLRPTSAHAGQGDSRAAGYYLGRRNTGEAMNFIIWIVVGGLLGWVASMIMRTDAQQGVFLNVIVGIVGALLAGWVVSPLVGIGTINQNAFSVGAMLVSLVGAIILLAIVNLVRRGRVR